MIELLDICKSYKGKEAVLKHLSLQLENKSMVTVQGASGSGKSTLLNILGLLDKADEGKYLFGGKDITKFSRKERILFQKKIGFIFQNYALIENYSVESNILIAGQYSTLDFDTIQKRMYSLLQTVSLQKYEKKKVKFLSG